MNPSYIALAALGLYFLMKKTPPEPVSLAQKVDPAKQAQQAADWWKREATAEGKLAGMSNVQNDIQSVAQGIGEVMQMTETLAPGPNEIVAGLATKQSGGGIEAADYGKVSPQSTPASTNSGQSGSFANIGQQTDKGEVVTGLGSGTIVLWDGIPVASGSTIRNPKTGISYVVTSPGGGGAVQGLAFAAPVYDPSAPNIITVPQGQAAVGYFVIGRTADGGFIMQKDTGQ